MKQSLKYKSLFVRSYIVVLSKKIIHNFQKYKMHIITLYIIFIISNCKKEENCSLSIDNCNGTIQNCECICNEGFFGDNCEEEQIPENIKIDRIKLEGLFNPCADFDENDTLDYNDADVYFEIFYRDTLVFSSLSQKVLNNYNGHTELFYLEGCTLNNPDKEYEMIFFDYDNGETPDIIEKIIFTPYKKGENFPDSIIIQENDRYCDIVSYFYIGKSIVEIYLKYTF